MKARSSSSALRRELVGRLLDDPVVGRAVDGAVDDADGQGFLGGLLDERQHGLDGDGEAVAARRLLVAEHALEPDALNARGPVYGKDQR